MARLWAPGYMATQTDGDSTVVMTRAERLRLLAEARAATSGSVDSMVVHGCTFRRYGNIAAGPCRVTQYVREGAEHATARVLVTVLFTRESGPWRILATHTATLSESK